MHLFPELHLDITKFKQHPGRKDQEKGKEREKQNISARTPQAYISHSKIVQSWKTEAERRAFFDSFAASKGMDPRNPDFWSNVAIQDLQRYQSVCFSLPLSPLPLSLNITSNQLLLILFTFIDVSLQGYRTILGYHKGQLSTCLMQLYPDIGLELSHFDCMCHLFPSLPYSHPL